MKRVRGYEREMKIGGSSFRRLFTSTLPHLITASLIPLASVPALACDACQKNQPAPLRGITHGTGPQHQWDMPIVIVAAILVGVTLVLALRMLVKPGERGTNHIKRIILNDTPIHHGA